MDPEEYTSLQSSRADIKLAIRIQDFQGGFDSTDDYFKHRVSRSKDQFSIQFSITFNDDDINGDDLIWGNDFDKPIRDILPLGFSAGLNIMKWAIEPSLEADPLSRDHNSLMLKRLLPLTRLLKTTIMIGQRC